MQLPQIDPLEFQSLETFIDSLCQIFRPPVRHPLSRTGPGLTAFGRNDESFRIRIQRFGNEQLVRFRTVSIGGIDEIHTQLERDAKLSSRSRDQAANPRSPRPSAASPQTRAG